MFISSVELQIQIGIFHEQRSTDYRNLFLTHMLVWVNFKERVKNLRILNVVQKF